MAGLYDKYDVQRKDGEPIEDRVFVLSPSTDPAALAALREYASTTTNVELGQDLLQWIWEIDVASQVYLPFSCPVCGRLRLLFGFSGGDRRAVVFCEKCGADAEVIDAEVERLVALRKAEERWKHERDLLLDMTRSLDEHPEGYEGPCMCQVCQSYGD